MSNYKSLDKLKTLLDKKQLKKVYYIIFLILVGMFFEMVGLGVLFPILSLIIDPTSLSKYKLFNQIFNFFNKPNQNTLTQILIFTLIGFYVIKTLFLLYLNWERNSFSINISKILSQKLFRGYLNQDFSFHLNNNSSTLLKNIQGEVQLFTSFATAIINISVEASFTFGVVMILIITEPKGAFIVLTFLGISAYIFSTITRKKLKKWSLERLNHSTIINKSLIEGLGGIKDLIIFNRSNYFYDRFSVENEKYSRIITKVNFLGTVPRLYLEMLSIIGISILIFVASSTNSHGTLVPILGIFAAAAFRIIPSLNSMMNSIQQIRFSSSTINLLYDELIKLDINKKQLIKTNLNEFKFERSILISNLNFRYDSTEREVLKNINLEIIKGESIGFIGTSGSGKSTLIDLIIGLYKTEAESIFVDGVSIRNNEIAWRKKIGYVPQSIFLIDDSLIKNIAFGIPENEINLEKVKNAIEAAQLHEFVNNLPANIETSVGERGVRISGGQKQRIGIARALYNNPEILILDEATSALDVKTENEIMQTIQELKGKITIIIVAHRLVTLENCDRVIVLEYGKIKEVGESENILSKYK